MEPQPNRSKQPSIRQYYSSSQTQRSSSSSTSSGSPGSNSETASSLLQDLFFTSSSTSSATNKSTGSVFSPASLRPGIKLLGHQEHGVRWIRDREAKGQGGLIWDEMGAGKTLQAFANVALSKQPGARGPTLFVSPPVLVQNGIKELNKFFHAKEIRLDTKEPVKFDKSVITYAKITNKMGTLCLERLKTCDIVFVNYHKLALAYKSLDKKVIELRNVMIEESSKKVPTGTPQQPTGLRKLLLQQRLEREIFVEGKPPAGIEFTAREKLFLVEYVRVIMDEAHTCKNIDTDFFKSCGKIRAKHVWPMTGTPILRDADDLYALFALAGTTGLGDLEAWRKNNKALYNKECNIFVSLDACSTLPANERPVALEYMNKHVLRRTQAEVSVLNGPENALPPLEVQIVSAEDFMHDSERELHDKLYAQCVLRNDKTTKRAPKRRKKAGDGSSDSPKPVKGVTCLLRAREVCVSGKLALENSPVTLTARSTKTLENMEHVNSTKMTLLNFVMKPDSGYIEREEKCVVFTQWLRVVDIIADSIRNADPERKIYKLHGSLTEKAKWEVLESFKSDNRKQGAVLIVTLDTGQQGLTLTEASVVLFVDVSTEPSKVKQATCRLYRTGQKKRVRAYHLVIKNSVEEAAYSLRNSKGETADKIVLSTKQRNEQEERFNKHKEEEASMFSSVFVNDDPYDYKADYDIESSNELQRLISSKPNRFNMAHSTLNRQK